MPEQIMFHSQSAGQRWSTRWLAMLKAMGLDTHLDWGRRYARRGRVQDLDVQVGRISARVQDREMGDCTVTIELNRLSDLEWERATDTLSSQAIFAAQLLAGELPGDIEQVFAQVGVKLLPAGAYELESHCSCCPSWQQPCQHATAVFYLIGEMLDEDPWLIFRLRGRDRQQILQALRQRRSDAGSGYANDASETLGATLREAQSPHRISSFIQPDQEVPSLVDQMEEFWGTIRQLESLHHHIAPPLIEQALLRRLGPPPFAAESLETYDQLKRIYRQVSKEALKLAYATTPETETEPREGDRGAQWEEA
jgi:uncharacterized Zn finger protein